MKLKGKKVLVVGLGLSGVSAVRFLLECGAVVAVTDRKAFEEFSPEVRVLVSSLEGHWGNPRKEIFQGRDLIVVSPGVPLDREDLVEARRSGVSILGEFGLAAEFLKSPLIAVTGTNGKSTTVSLIGEILKQSGKKVMVAGNIGTPLLEAVMSDKPWDWVVAEVSSYQLETVRKFRPQIALLLNITEDHLDRYPSMEGYAQAKFRLFEEQGPKDFLIYNDNDPRVRAGVQKAKAQKIPFSQIVLPSLDRATLTGVHNRENMTAAVEAARLAGASPEAIQQTLENFHGLPHRTEFVRELRGVRYYDDSKGTNVDAAVKSLSGFPDKKVILIAGGRDKGGDYRPLSEAAQKKVKLAVLIGEAREKIARALEGSTEIIQAERMERAVPLAAQRAESGDIVLLSPACSSFDQFRDYKERGDLFQKLVKKL